jgi:hypothetical protein
VTEPNLIEFAAAVALTLTSIDTTNTDDPDTLFGEHATAEYVAEKLTDVGTRSAYVESGGRIGTTSSCGSRAPTGTGALLIHGHLDVRRIVGLRRRQRLGSSQIGGRPRLPALTVHAVLVRCRINRLTHIDRLTGGPLRRYEHAYPGSLSGDVRAFVAEHSEGFS